MIIENHKYELQTNQRKPKKSKDQYKQIPVAKLVFVEQEKRKMESLYYDYEPTKIIGSL